MPKFKKNKTTANEIDTSDMTGVRSTLYWIKQRVRVDPADPDNLAMTMVDVPMVQFALPDGGHFDGKLEDLAADKEAVLAMHGDMLNASLAAHSDYDVV